MAFLMLLWKNYNPSKILLLVWSLGLVPGITLLLSCAICTGSRSSIVAILKFCVLLLRLSLNRLLLSTVINVCVPQRSMRSSEAIKLNYPDFKSNKTYGDRAFMFSAPKTWNALPAKIRSLNNYDSFKSALKTFLFDEFYSS